MNELLADEYHRIVPLVEQNETQGIAAAVYSVLEGTRPGRVLADDPTAPRMAIVDAGDPRRHHLYLFGDPDPGDFRRLVPELIAGRLPANGMPLWTTPDGWRGEGCVLQATSVAWRALLQSLFSVRRARLVFDFQDSSWVSALDRQKQAPAGFDLCPIHDRPIGWEGRDINPERGFGYCVRFGDHVVSRCFCEFLGGKRVEITVVTDAGFERRGLAYLVCCAFIDECLANGLRPAWSCDATNDASAGLAAKLGFVKSFDLIGYLLHPSFQLLEGRWGPPLVPDIRGYDEESVGQEVEAIYRRALDAGVSAFSLLPGRQGVTVWHHFGEAVHEVDALPGEMQGSLFARVKQMTGMNIGEQGWQQYGRCTIEHRGAEHVMRMTCLPSTYGDEILVHLSGRPPLKRIPVVTRAGEELWMHGAESENA